MPDAPPPELRQFAEERLLYEVQMLRRLTDELQRVVDHAERGRSPDELYPLAVRNAMVESFALRARLLLDFIFAHGSREDDTFAEHYVAGVWAPTEPDWAEGVRVKVNKGVAHLTYHQLLDQPKEWQFGQIWRDLAQLLKDFASQVSTDRLPPEVANQILGLVDIDSEEMVYSASVTDSRFVAGHVSTASESRALSADAPTTPVSDLVEQAKREEPPT